MEPTRRLACTVILAVLTVAVTALVIATVLVVHDIREMRAKSLGCFEGHHGWVDQLVFSPASDILVSTASPPQRLFDGENDTTQIIAWSVPDGRRLGSITRDRQWCAALGFSRAGNLVDVDLSKGRVTTFNPVGGRALAAFDIPVCTTKDSSYGLLVAFNASRDRIAFNTEKGAIYVWSLTGLKLAEIQATFPYVGALAFTSDGTRLAVVSSTTPYWGQPRPGSLEIWLIGADGGSKQLLVTQHAAHEWCPVTAQFLPGGDLAMFSEFEKRMDVVAPTGKVVRSFSTNDKGRGYPVVFSEDGQLRAAGSIKGEVKLCTAEGRLLAHHQAHTRRTTALAFSPDRSLLASGSEDGTVRLWPVPSFPSPLPALRPERTVEQRDTDDILVDDAVASVESRAR